MALQVTIYGDEVDNSTTSGALTAEEQSNISASSVSGTPATPVITSFSSEVSPTDPDYIATVTATPQGDVINGVQTNTNATADVGNVTIINTSTIEDYSNANKGLPASSVGTQQVVVSNPLHSYASYTYGLSLNLMEVGTGTANDYNVIMQTGNYTATNVLIASAGKYTNTNSFHRNPVFSDDFYFEDFKMNTVIGTTPRSRSTNVIDFNFTIIEPNGFSLINRLLEVSMVNGIKNYLEAPYMLQIDFYGYDDAGNAKHVIEQTKHVPIRMLSMKTKLTAKGAEYRITAAIYSHRSYDESVAATPTNFQVQAATVRDFFGSGLASVDAYNTAYGNDQRIESLLNEKNAATTDAQRETIQSQLNQIADLNQVYTVKEGYANAVNGWYQYLQLKRKRLTLDTVTIMVDPEIANAQVTLPEKNDTRRMANPTKAEQNSARSAALGVTVGGPKFTEGYYPVNAGTPVDKVIESVVRTSTYITSQITDPQTDNPESIAQKLGRPLKWFKIVTKVTLGDYDHVTGQYAKHYTYYVKQWTVSNKLPVAPMGKASGFVKKYEYIYTGHNSDVIDVSIDFDTLCYLAITENKNQNQEVVSMKRPNYLITDYNAPEIYPAYTVMPKMINYHSQDMQYSGQFNAARDPKAMSTGDLTRDITGTARGDMLNVKLTILGDPTFIKQDDVFYNISERRSGRLLTANNSIVMDEGELYVLLLFKSPTDYDEVTGLGRNNQYNYNMFSGVYGVTTIENSFSRGKFTQILSLYRLSNQPAYDDLLGGQYSQVFQYQRIEQQILNAALTPLQNIARNAAGQILGSLSSVLAVASAAAQIAQNAQSIATGILSQVVNNAVTRVSNLAMGWVKETILTPLGTWFDNITTQVGQWFDDALFKAEMFFTGNWDTYTSEYLTCTADSLATDITNIGQDLTGALDFSSLSQEGINSLIESMGLETFDAVDDAVFDSLDW